MHNHTKQGITENMMIYIVTGYRKEIPDQSIKYSTFDT